MHPMVRAAQPEAKSQDLQLVESTLDGAMLKGPNRVFCKVPASSALWNSQPSFWHISGKKKKPVSQTLTYVSLFQHFFLSVQNREMIDM